MDRMLCWLGPLLQSAGRDECCPWAQRLPVLVLAEGPTLVFATTPRKETTASGVVCLFEACWGRVLGTETLTLFPSGWGSW